MTTHPSDDGAVLCGSAALRRSWHAVARSVEVSPGPRRVRLLGEDLVLYRTEGIVVAAADVCPHRQAPLSAGRMSDGCLVCPYHGWQFAGGGQCVRVPSAAEHVPPPPRAHLHALPCVERYGLVWVALDQPDDAVPVIPEDDDPAFRRINTPVDIWKVSATRMTDNFLDVTHFPFVHTGTFGRAQDTVAPKVELSELDHGWFGYAYPVTARNSDLGTMVSGQADELVERQMSSGFSLPFAVRSTIDYHTGLRHVLLLLSTPVDGVTSLFTFVVWRNDDFSASAEEIIRFDLAIGAEDKVMLEKIPGVLPLDQTSLVSVQADKCSVEWRRRFAALLTA